MTGSAPYTPRLLVVNARGMSIPWPIPTELEARERNIFSFLSLCTKLTADGQKEDAKRHLLEIITLLVKTLNPNPHQYFA